MRLTVPTRLAGMSFRLSTATPLAVALAQRYPAGVAEWYTSVCQIVVTLGGTWTAGAGTVLATFHAT